MDKLAILEQFALYVGASEMVKREMERFCIPATVPQGQPSFEEGSVCTHIALIGAGDIRVFKRADNGREITLYHVRQGDVCILNTACLLSGTTYQASTIAEKETEVVLLPAANFQRWFLNDPAVREFIFATQGERMSDLMMLIEEVVFARMDERLIGWLLNRAASSGSQIISITQEKLAFELGTAREVVTRLLRDMQNDGLLRVSRGSVELLDVESLTRLRR